MRHPRNDKLGMDPIPVNVAEPFMHETHYISQLYSRCLDSYAGRGTAFQKIPKSFFAQMNCSNIKIPNLKSLEH